MANIKKGPGFLNNSLFPLFEPAAACPADQGVYLDIGSYHRLHSRAALLCQVFTPSARSFVVNGQSARRAYLLIHPVQNDRTIIGGFAGIVKLPLAQPIGAGSHM
jgi:hypothetical protein